MSEKKTKKSKRPNILLIMADEYRFPRSFDQPDAGMKLGIKNILGFQDEKTKRQKNGIKKWEQYFPGLMKLRKNAIVLKNHTIASSACVPSRAAMFTGQYGTRTGVTQTDGILKDGHSPNFPWLDPDGIPTIGDWLRTDGYQTHYFGKCHFADPPHHSLQKFGFNDWEKSYPDPHGSARNNLGMYRDHGFADLVTTFLRGKGLALEYNRQEASGKEESDEKPWFAVASFTNPHDITTYPMLTASLEQNINMDNLATLSKSLAKLKKEIEKIKETKARPPLKIPTKNEKSKAPDYGTWEINMNPDGFPQDNADLPETWNEDLQNNNKPDCQYEYSLKLGLAIASGIGIGGVALRLANNSPRLLGMPLPMTDDPADNSLKYLQYYTYLHQVVDQHIDRLLTTIEETGLRDNTIVIFAPDHGEYGAAHGQMAQKWHSAYQEAIHVPVVVSLPPNCKKAKKGKGAMKQVEELTSHIDILPTILGLAGIDEKRRKQIAKKLKRQNHDVPKLVGADLTNLIYGTQKGPITPLNSNKPRKGILFLTDDMITQKLKGEKYEPYDVFLKCIDHYKTDSKKYKEMFKNVEEGSVCQPCHVMCVREGDWKLVKYFDPKGKKANQWEMYNLEEDSAEKFNLLKYNGAFPTVYSPIKQGPTKLSAKVIKSKAKSLHKLMIKLANEMLPPEK